MAKDQFGMHDIEGRLLSEIPVDQYWIDHLGKVVLSCSPQRFEIYASWNGCWYSIYTFFIYSNGSKRLAVFSKDISSDVAERNELKKSLKAQDEIFANVSHELKTPLNVIFGSVQLMELHLENPAVDILSVLSKKIQTIKQNCYRFMKLINQNIVEIVEGIVQSVSEYVKDRNIHIVFDTEFEEKSIACDAEKIERIILNLISNAVKFTNPGGTITVDVSEKEDAVVIRVIDTGIGIEEKDLELIFRRYHQVDKTLSRNVEGTGIGLALVKSLVELHHGKIGVVSQVGKGSTFTVLIPSKVIDDCIVSPKTLEKCPNKVEILNIEFSDIYQ